MHKSLLSLFPLLSALALAGCASTKPTSAPAKDDPVTSNPAKPPPPSAQERADALLKAYLTDYARLENAAASTYWTAALSGKKEDFDLSAAADLEMKLLHSDAARYQEIVRLLAEKDQLKPETVRSLELADLAFKGNQLPKETLEAMAKAQAEIEQAFNTYRAEVGGKKLTNNDLLDVLRKEKDVKKRQAAWEASKAVGAQVAQKLVALAKVRNLAAKALGYEDYWDMQVRLQEHDPKLLLPLFDELEKLTDGPYADMKKKLDAEVAKRFKVKPEQLMPWHYSNPFFQDAPPMEKADLDDFFKDKKKEDIAAFTQRFYDEIGLDMRPIAARSDFYEKEGKNQHAFCITFDRKDDVRTLLNVKPTNQWMETMLHEMGHALYYTGIDQSMLHNQREAAHILTTEGVAMLFGALAKNPLWLKEYAGADPKKLAKMEKDILEQRRREQLIFVRWGMVMLRFEKELYAKPDQDLNKLWWDIVERYQGLKRPAGRDQPDWASKPHFTIAPVYYHNYVLGELFAAQMRAQLAKMANHTGPTSSLSFNGRKDFGEYLKTKIFKPGMSQHWPDFVQAATDAPLSPAAFASEVT
ncbi:MAG: M3 family oligoendopeptidase [Deltaproteobacteria bacterium]|nr:M3 family oligoendopeptidase [Deltaproteobacteria bacterium]